MKNLVLAILVVLFGTTVCLAQTGHAFTYGPVSQEQLAVAIENGDQKILRIKIETLVEAAQKAWPEKKIKNRSNLAEYIRSLTVTPGPVGPARFSRVFNNGKVDFNWRREIRKDELFLYDNNSAEYILSLSCGNFVFGVSLKEVFKEKVPPLSSYFQIPGSKGDQGSPCPQGNQGPPRRNGHDRIVEVESFSFWASPWPYVIGGGIIVGGGYYILRHHHEEEEMATPTGPGVTTGGAGPGVSTGGAKSGRVTIAPLPQGGFSFKLKFPL